MNEHITGDRTSEITANFAELLPIQYLEKCADRLLMKARDKQSWLNAFWNVIAQKTAFKACRKTDENQAIYGNGKS